MYGVSSLCATIVIFPAPVSPVAATPVVALFTLASLLIAFVSKVTKLPTVAVVAVTVIEKELITTVYNSPTLGAPKILI